MEPTKLIAVYARVSTARQEEEQTIQNQLIAVREDAQKKGLTIVREYIDDGWSGDILARPELDQLRQDAKKKAWEAVLIYDPDRLARRYSYQELVMDELREAGIEVLFVTVSSPKNPEDKILHGVRGLFSEYERAKISERFRLGKLRKVREGHLLVSQPLYGYRYIPKNGSVHGYYEVNEVEARIVKMIFNWIAGEGLTIRKVVRRLQEFNIKPKKSKRGVWNTSTLITMLRNKSYIGRAHWGSSYAVVPERPLKIEKYKKMRKSSRRNKPEEEWLASNIPVPPIINESLFERAQTQLKANQALAQRNRKNEYLLAGKIYCTCGIRRHGEGPQKGKHLYYRCSERIYSFPLVSKCTKRGINARIADRLVWDRLTTLMTSPELLMAQAKRWTDVQQTKRHDSLGDAAIIGKEILKLKAQEERYNRAYGAGLFTMEQLREYAIPIRSQISAFEIQAAKIRQGDYQAGPVEIPGLQEIQAFTDEVRTAIPNLNFAAKRRIIMSVLKKVVGTQEHLEVSGSVPIINSYVNLQTIHRHCRPAKRG